MYFFDEEFCLLRRTSGGCTAMMFLVYVGSVGVCVGVGLLGFFYFLFFDCFKKRLFLD